MSHYDRGEATPISPLSSESDVHILRGFPDELQRAIFEIAARSNASCALRLVLVAKHVRTWIEPTLYEIIIVRRKDKASRFLETIKSKPPGFSNANVRYLAIGSEVTFQQTKAILSECSERIVDFAVWKTDRNPTVSLPSIRSSSIRRLSLRSQHPSELNIPPNVLSCLTHLIILDGPYTWFHLRNAMHHLKHTDKNHPDYISSVTVFRNLTHFGVDSQHWGSARSLLKVAKNLQYFAIIVSPQFKAMSTVTQRIAELDDRRVVLVEHDHTVENWEASIRGGEDLWDRVETLVKGGYCSAQRNTQDGQKGSGARINADTPTPSTRLPAP